MEPVYGNAVQAARQLLVKCAPSLVSAYDSVIWASHLPIACSKPTPCGHSIEGTTSVTEASQKGWCLSLKLLLTEIVTIEGLSTALSQSPFLIAAFPFWQDNAAACLLTSIPMRENCLMD